MNTIAKSYLERKNQTRGNFGELPRPRPVKWDEESQLWLEDMNVKLEDAVKAPENYTWGCWDSVYGWIAPWPADDVTIDNRTHTLYDGDEK